MCSPTGGRHAKLPQNALHGMDPALSTTPGRVSPLNPWPRIRTLALVIAALAATTGCRSLLPNGDDRTLQPWSTYNDAYSAVDHIVPYHTTRQALREQKIDPAVNPAITILSYTDLLQRLNAMAAVAPENRERGIADCLNAGKRCTAYAIDLHQTRTRRVGNFWLDLLNFRRHTVTTGWTFSGLIIFVDDVAVFALAGGQPNVNTEQVSRNPLGPIQGVGISISPSLP
jgi:hypothetical protein